MPLKILAILFLLALAPNALAQRSGGRSSQSSGPTGGESGGGGDPRAGELVQLAKYFCEWIGTRSEFKSHAKKCEDERLDLLKSLQDPKREPRVFSRPDEEVVDPIGNPKDGYVDLITRTIRIAVSRWPCDTAEEKLRIVAMEMGILIGMIDRRYDIGGVFVESEIAREAARKHQNAAPCERPPARDNSTYYACKFWCGPVKNGILVPNVDAIQYGTMAQNAAEALEMAKSWCADIANACKNPDYQIYQVANAAGIPFPARAEHCRLIYPKLNIMPTFELALRLSRERMDEALRNYNCAERKK